MKKSEVKVGGLYLAKVSGNLVTVKVTAVREVWGYGPINSGRVNLRYDVTNLSTGRRTTFRSAAKFRSEVKAKV